jgi:hypothetical protein
LTLLMSGLRQRRRSSMVTGATMAVMTIPAMVGSQSGIAHFFGDTRNAPWLAISAATKTDTSSHAPASVHST